MVRKNAFASLSGMGVRSLSAVHLEYMPTGCLCSRSAMRETSADADPQAAVRRSSHIRVQVAFSYGAACVAACTSSGEKCSSGW
eukprot:scaffold1087_cov198-Pinguiococcus_pyrenoidosus.AAC.11